MKNYAEFCFIKCSSEPIILVTVNSISSSLYKPTLSLNDSSYFDRVQIIQNDWLITELDNVEFCVNFHLTNMTFLKIAFFIKMLNLFI